MSGASCPSLQHTPCNTQCWLRLGYMPWPLSLQPLHRAAQLEKIPNITGTESHGAGLPAPARSITPGSGHTAPDLSLPLGTLTSCLCTPHFGSFLIPNIWYKSAPPPACPCLLVLRALWLAGTAAALTAGARVGNRGNLRWRGSLHPQRLSQLRVCSCCLGEGRRGSVTLSWGSWAPG